MRPGAEPESRIATEGIGASPKEHSYPVKAIHDTVDQSLLNLHSVPEVSYSSSDDDDFYDAPEESSPVNPLKPIKAINSVNQVIEGFDDMTLKSVSSVSAVSAAGLLDYDKMYESEEDELGSIESHGSVISHLISQVKIGMDLTKVVLPTFILERRSLLEMYADFFAHPDIFVRCLSISDKKIHTNNN